MPTCVFVFVRSWWWVTALFLVRMLRRVRAGIAGAPSRGTGWIPGILPARVYGEPLFPGAQHHFPRQARTSL